MVAYSAISSKLAWYIAPAYPGMALLIGGAVAFVITKALQAFRSKGTPVWRRACLGMLTCACVVLLGYNLYRGTVRVLNPRSKLHIERLITGIKEHLKEHPDCRIVYYRRPHFGRAEGIYMRQLRKQTIRMKLKQPIESVLHRVKGREVFIIADDDEIPPGHKFPWGEPDQTYFAPFSHDRFHKIAVLHWGATVKLPQP